MPLDTLVRREEGRNLPRSAHWIIPGEIARRALGIFQRTGNGGSYSGHNGHNGLRSLLGSQYILKVSQYVASLNPTWLKASHHPEESIKAVHHLGGIAYGWHKHYEKTPGNHQLKYLAT